MKKIASIILMAVFLAVSLLGCIPSKGPEKTVEEVMNLIKNSEIEELAEFLGSEGNEITEEDDFLELIKLSNQSLTYEIASKEITEDKAVVTVHCSYGDVREIIAEAFDQYTDKAIGLALSGEEVTDAQIEEMLFEEIKKAMQTVGTKDYATTIQVYCSKIEGEWVIDDSDENMPLADVITGNLISAFEALTE